MLSDNKLLDPADYAQVAQRLLEILRFIAKDQQRLVENEYFAADDAYVATFKRDASELATTGAPPPPRRRR